MGPIESLTRLDSQAIHRDSFAYSTGRDVVLVDSIDEAIAAAAKRLAACSPRVHESRPVLRSSIETSMAAMLHSRATLESLAGAATSGRCSRRSAGSRPTRSRSACSSGRSNSSRRGRGRRPLWSCGSPPIPTRRGGGRRVPFPPIAGERAAVSDAPMRRCREPRRNRRAVRVFVETPLARRRTGPSGRGTPHAGVSVRSRRWASCGSRTRWANWSPTTAGKCLPGSRRSRPVGCSMTETRTRTARRSDGRRAS